MAEDKIEADIVKEVMSNETAISEEESRERVEGAKVGIQIAEIISREGERTDS